MVKLVLYGNGKSVCTQKILILLEELELKYDFVKVDLSDKENKKSEYCDKHPFGEVPYMEYGDLKLFESRSILRYISKANRDFKDLYGDVNVDMWLEVEGQNYNPAIATIIWERVLKKNFNDDSDEDEVNKALNKLESIFEVYNKQLERHEYLAGLFSIADIGHIPYMYQFLKCESFTRNSVTESPKDILKKYPNVYNWVKRLLKMDIVRDILRKN